LIWIQGRLATITLRPSCSIASLIAATLVSWFLGNGSINCRCFTPKPRTSSISWSPEAIESCAPVIAVVELSRMSTVMLASFSTAPRSGVIPEWAKVESPIVQSTGNAPAREAPCAMPIEAPISTAE